MKAIEFKLDRFHLYDCDCANITKEACYFDHSGTYYPAAEVDAREKQVAELVEAAREVVTISDRKHDAWDKLKAALAPFLEAKP